MLISTVKVLITALIFSFLLFATASAQSNVFTYQGSLNNAGLPANGSYDFEFALFDAPNAGAQVGPAVPRNSVAVSNGIFSVQLDFGTVFTGPGRYLEIRVRQTGQPGFTTLTPRQFVASSPYSIKSLNTESLGGTPASQFVLTNDPRMSDARVPTAGSGDYIQNRASQQTGTNFNISGNGIVGGTFTAHTVSATTQFNIGTGRVLGVAGSDNTFVGLLAGTSNTGNGNSFFGSNAGTITINGSNSFFGAAAGRINTSGFQNAFFGYASGSENSTGDNNTFYGAHSGHFNTTASDNSFFGSAAGYNNTIGGSNAFFGTRAGRENTGGGGNSFFGYQSGYLNTTGIQNSFFGVNAGTANTTGQNNAFFGANAGAANTIALGNSFFGANAGAANIAQFNSFFGASAGAANTTGFNNSFFGTVAGVANTTADYNSFFGHWAGHDTTTGGQNAFFGALAGESNTTGTTNTFIGRSAGESSTSGHANTFVGYLAGNSNTTGIANTALGDGAGPSTGDLTFATAIGAGTLVTQSNIIQLGRSAGTESVWIPGILRLVSFAGGANTDLCANFGGQVGLCSSSLRYKRDVREFNSGLSIVRKLRPIAFAWKDDGHNDIGFAAEEVAKVEPRFVRRGATGQIEGVKYGQITTALVNAVKEQQAEIERQAKVIESQQRQIDGLMNIVCSAKRRAEVCKEGRR